MNALQSFAAWMADVFGMVVRHSVQGAVVAVLVGTILLVLGKRLSARWRYLLWMLVVLRLAVPVSIESPWSLQDLMPRMDSVAKTGESAEHGTSGPVITGVTLSPKEVNDLYEAGVLDKSGAAPAAERASLLSNAGERRPKVQSPFNILQTLALIWMGGVVVMLVRIAGGMVRLRRLVRQMEEPGDAGAMELLEQSAREMRVRRAPKLLVGDQLRTPALVGFWRPMLLMPQGVLETFDRRELRLIFLHELAHQRRGDVLVNWLLALVGAVHWFNPVAWWALSRARAERELACDEMVLSRGGEAERREMRRAYGTTMIKLLQSLSRGSVAPGSVGILEGRHLLKRRMAMIASFDGRRRGTILAAVAGLVLGAVALTGPVRGEKAPDAGGGSPAGSGAPVAGEGTAPGGEEGGATPPIGSLTGAPEAAPGRAPTPGMAGRGGRGGGGAPMPGGGGDGGGMRGGHPGRSLRGPGPMVDEEATFQTWEALKKRIPEVNFSGVALGDAIDFLRDVSGLNIHVNWRQLEEVGIPRDAQVTLRARNLPAWQALKMVLADVSNGLHFEVEGGLVTVSAYGDARQEVVTKAYEVRDLLELSDIGVADVSNDPRMVKAMEQLDTERRSLEVLKGHGDAHRDVVLARQRVDALERDIARLRQELESKATPNQVQTMRQMREEKIGQLVSILTSTVAPDSWRDAGGNLGTISGFNTKLIISTSEANHREVEKVLQMIRAK